MLVQQWAVNMSKWLDKLNPASFRGVPFYLMEDSTATVGRRRANHEYAGRDQPFSEDLGRKQRVYSIVGGVDGDDFIEQANRLQDAFETAGPGKLVHPYLGELSVTVEATFTYQGRFASFQLTAEEAGTDNNPVGVVDTRNEVIVKAGLAKQSSIDSFVDNFNVTGPEFVRELTLSSIESAIKNISVSAFSSVDNLAAEIQNPSLVANAIFNAVLGENNRLSALANFTNNLNAPASQTIARQRIAKNNTAANQLIAQAIVIEESRTLVDVNFETQSQALDKVNDVVNAIDTVSLTADDKVYRQLVEVRSAIQQDMQSRSPSLPQLQKIKLNQMVPVLVAAYRYTGSVANEQQIIDRNSVSHPGFVRGDIEVINV
jgi:prophage DNA circulation protein